METWPRPMALVTGPFSPERIAGAADGMGDYGDATRAVHRMGLVQPDLITGMTLFLIARQPRRPRSDGQAKSNGVSGGVWVRERFTIHRPVSHTDAFAVGGESTGTYSKRGRRYSTTASNSHTSAGELLATNLTTGLLSYRPDPDLPDGSEGLKLEDTPAPVIDHDAAVANPHANELTQLCVGDVLGGESVLVSLEMMAARDTSNPDNPIHSDAAEAKKAGLARPIAGGSHVLAFALEPVMARVGPQALLHGTNFDVRWKAPTQDGARIVPTATVIKVGDDRVQLDLRVDLADGPTAMVGHLAIPIAR